MTNIIKKRAIIILIISICFGLFGCNSDSSSNKDTPTPPPSSSSSNATITGSAS